MAGENKKALDVLIDKIIYIVDKKNEKLKYDKTFKSVILGKLSDNIYEINYLGQIYHIPNVPGTAFSVGQLVWVKIPGGDFKEMHICGAAAKSG